MKEYWYIVAIFVGLAGAFIYYLRQFWKALDGLKDDHNW